MASATQNTQTSAPLHQSVKVYIRQRPFSLKERTSSQAPGVYKQYLGLQDILLISHKNTEKKYTFDRVFDENVTQTSIFQTVVSPLIPYVINGYNCTVFAYGQTGSGKTHTIFGSSNNKSPTSCFQDDASHGLIPRTAQQLFSDLSLCTFESSVSVSFIEIINEELRDLLAEKGKNELPIRLCEDVTKTLHQKNSITNVSDVDEVLTLIQRGTKQRQTHHQSHSLFTFTVRVWKSIKEGEEELTTTSRLHFVDLAGSSTADANTHRSLTTLEMVIKALARKNPIHVPYRSSKLTRLLQDSLGGQAVTCMVATIAPPVLGSWRKTVQTLECASSARRVVNCPRVNVEVALSRRYAEVIKELSEEMAGLGDYRRNVGQPESLFKEIEDRIDRSLNAAYELWILRQSTVKMRSDLRKVQNQNNSNVEYAKAVEVFNARIGFLLKEDEQNYYMKKCINSFKVIFGNSRRRLKLIHLNLYAILLRNDNSLLKMVPLMKVNLISAMQTLIGMYSQLPLARSRSFEREFDKLLKEVENLVWNEAYNESN